MTYRNKAILASAMGERCTVCGADDGTVVWAHCNEQQAGKGMGHKSHDLIGAYMCQRHHDLYDGRAGGLDRDAKKSLFAEAYVKTMIRIAEKLEAGELRL